MKKITQNTITSRNQASARAIRLKRYVFHSKMTHGFSLSKETYQAECRDENRRVSYR